MGEARDHPVVVVTGGGGGIGAAVATALGRDGAFVVTMDPLVTLDGSEQLPPPEETTEGRIQAAGGMARASAVSVTDAAGVQELLTGLVEEFGRLDAVVNVAGITRPTSFAAGSEDDWRAVLAVHLGGYLNVLRAALPIMTSAGRGRVVGVTSGSGWRAADAGAYSCAKRAVAALTWQLGPLTPPGVVVNAMSPIAATRMVTEALARHQAASGPPSATGGLSLGSMPAPEELGPLGAHLAGERFAWCGGEVIFAGGSEIAVVQSPRLLEVVRTDDVRSLDKLFDTVVPGAFAPANQAQSSGGGGNPRFGTMSEGSDEETIDDAARTVLVVGATGPLADAVVAALARRRIDVVTSETRPSDFAGAAALLDGEAMGVGGLDAVVVVPALASSQTTTDDWAKVLDAHDEVAGGIQEDAALARAAADHATASNRPVRLITLVDATTSGGRSRAQANAQLSRPSLQATDGRVTVFSIAVESRAASDLAAVASLAAHLTHHPDAPAVAGAELVVASGWTGLRSHPHPSTSIALGGPSIPTWLDDVLRESVDHSRAIEETSRYP